MQTYWNFQLTLCFFTIFKAAEMVLDRAFFWDLPGIRFFTRARILSICITTTLSTLKIKPSPQDTWSPDSLRIGATSQCAAAGVQEYRIFVQGDLSAGPTFQELYFDGGMQPCDDSFFFSVCSF